MEKSPAGTIQLVDVTTDDFANGVAKKQLWAAAVSRELAVGLVLGAVPEGWTAVLATTRLTPGERAKLKMQPGDVRKLSEPAKTPRRSKPVRSIG